MWLFRVLILKNRLRPNLSGTRLDGFPSETRNDAFLRSGSSLRSIPDFLCSCWKPRYPIRTSAEARAIRFYTAAKSLSFVLFRVWQTENRLLTTCFSGIARKSRLKSHSFLLPRLWNNLRSGLDMKFISETIIPDQCEISSWAGLKKRMRMSQDCNKIWREFLRIDLDRSHFFPLCFFPIRASLITLYHLFSCFYISLQSDDTRRVLQRISEELRVLPVNDF